MSSFNVILHSYGQIANLFLLCERNGESYLECCVFPHLQNIGLEMGELEFLFMFTVQAYSETVCLLLNSRAQDKAALQLSEMEEEMDQRIQAAEHKTRKDVSFWDWHSCS